LAYRPIRIASIVHRDDDAFHGRTSGAAPVPSFTTPGACAGASAGAFAALACAIARARRAASLPQATTITAPVIRAAYSSHGIWASTYPWTGGSLTAMSPAT